VEVLVWVSWQVVPGRALVSLLLGFAEFGRRHEESPNVKSHNEESPNEKSPKDKQGHHC
jgi:hypothetical protein